MLGILHIHTWRYAVVSSGMIKAFCVFIVIYLSQGFGRWHRYPIQQNSHGALAWPDKLVIARKINNEVSLIDFAYMNGAEPSIRYKFSE